MMPAGPAPEPADPDLPDDRRISNVFDPWRGRRNDNRFAVVVRPVRGDDRTTARDRGSDQQGVKDSVFHERASVSSDDVYVTNGSRTDKLTKPLVLYKLLQFSGGTQRTTNVLQGVLLAPFWRTRLTTSVITVSGRR